MSNMRSSDMSRGMTLRNAGAHRRLEGQIKTLDAQLRQNLVSLQAEIMAVKASPYAVTRRSRARSPAREVLSGKEIPRRRAKTPEPATKGDSASSGQQHHSPKLPRIKISPNDSATSFLPEITSGDHFLVTRGLRGSLTPPTRRRQSGQRASLSVSPLALPTNLHRPRSLPNVVTALAEDSVLSVTRKQFNPRDDQPLDGISAQRSLVKNVETPQSGAHQEGGELAEPLRRSSKALEQAEGEGTQRDESAGDLDDGDGRESETREFHSDEDLSLFRNSLLIKAARDDGLSGSLPDLKKLGFVDFNEAIDQRLRKLQEEIPSAEEMRKIRYLRLRDEPATPDILSVFDKDP